MPLSEKFKNKYLSRFDVNTEKKEGQDAKNKSEAQLIIERLKNKKQIEEKQPEEKRSGKKGFLSKVGVFTKEVGKDIATGFGRLGVSGYNIISAGGELVSAGVEGILGKKEKVKKHFYQAGEEAGKSRKIPFLGKIKPIMTPKDVIGVGADIASNIIGGGAGKVLVKQGLRGLGRTTIKNLAEEGLAIGFSHGTGKALQEDKTIGEALTEGAKEGVIGAVATPVIGAGIYGLSKGAKKVTSLFEDTGRVISKDVKQVTGFLGLPKKATETVDDVINRVAEVYDNKTPAKMRNIAEKTAPGLTIREKWAEIRPDIKKRIANKEEKLKEFFDVAHARNLDDKAPTMYGYGGKQVEKRRDEMVKVLNNTGSDIGKFREKIKTVRASNDDIIKIENKYKDELNKLNLYFDKGVIKQKSGTVKKVSDSEIKLFQNLYNDNIKILKQSPTVANLIDSRIDFDNKINFAKDAREVSNIVDPVSRKMRYKIAEINRNIIGKEQSDLLLDYSEAIEAIQDLNKFVDSRSGGEYLIRLVLSGRGNRSKELLRVIEKYTGHDLMDDAVMAKIATELIGNADQQSLFRQEIEKAGLNVASFFRRDKIGGLQMLYDFGKDKLINREKEFLRAARKKN